MSGEQEIADRVNRAIKDVLDGIDDDDSIRVAWSYAVMAAQDIAMEALATGKKLESISIVSVEGGLEVRFEIIEPGSINSVSVEGVISV